MVQVGRRDPTRRTERPFTRFIMHGVIPMALALFIFNAPVCSSSALDELTPITGLALCNPRNATAQNRTLKYADGSLHPVKIPFAAWVSAQILSQVAHILLTEVMGYKVELLENAGKDSGQPVRYAAGCEDVIDLTCAKNDISHPKIHFTIETWPYGINVAARLPSDIQPELLSVLDYNTYLATYLWSAVVEAAAAEKLSLDFFKGYDTAFRPHRFFDRWTRMLELIPSQYIVRCSEMIPGSVNDRDIENYMRVRAARDRAVVAT
jgi:hypothetical protein